MARTGTGLLAVWTGVDPEVEAEFNEWYDKEHVPERLAVPGFLSGIRYTAVEGEPKYLALYELDNENVLKSDAYVKVSKLPTPWTQKIVKHFRNMARREYRQIFSFGNRPDKDAEFVLTVRLNTPPEHEAEFNEWYNIDHFRSARRVLRAPLRRGRRGQSQVPGGLRDERREGAK